MHDVSSLASDPLRSLVKAYESSAERFNARNDSDAVEDALHNGLYDVLALHTPPCTTHEGAVEALALVMNSIRAGDNDGFQKGVLTSVLNFIQVNG